VVLFRLEVCRLPKRAEASRSLQIFPSFFLRMGSYPMVAHYSVC